MVCNPFAGVINGTWKVVAQNGSVNFNEETSLIEIEQDGSYSFYASVCILYLNIKVGIISFYG